MVTKRKHADVGAAKMWLHNRDRNRWKERPGEQVVTVRSAEELSDDELARIAAGSSRGAVEAPHGEGELH